jgi:hypothetical protein
MGRNFQSFLCVWTIIVSVLRFALLQTFILYASRVVVMVISVNRFGRDDPPAQIRELIILFRYSSPVYISSANLFCG